MTEQLRSALDSDVVKITLRIAALIAIPWSAWVTKSVIELHKFQHAGGRFTAHQAFQLEQRLDARMDSLPPPFVRDQIQRMQDDIVALRNDLVAFERDFSANFVRKDEL